MKSGFIYSVDGHTYLLVPVYHVTDTGRIFIDYVEMYTPAGVFMGTWYRHNMPMPLIRELAQHVKRFVVVTPRKSGRRSLPNKPRI